MADTKILSTEEQLALVFEQIKTLQEENSQMRSALSKVPAATEDAPKPLPTIPDKTFKVDGTEYKFVAPHFIYGKETVTALDALSDPDILADLVRVESGVIREVE